MLSTNSLKGISDVGVIGPKILKGILDLVTMGHKKETLETGSYEFDGEEGEEYSEKVLSVSDKKIRPAEKVGPCEWVGSRYHCRNCSSSRIKTVYTEEAFVQIPNPSLFGDRVKPVKTYRWNDISHYCDQCGLKGKGSDLEKVVTISSSGDIFG